MGRIGPTKNHKPFNLARFWITRYMFKKRKKQLRQLCHKREREGGEPRSPAQIMGHHLSGQGDTVMRQCTMKSSLCPITEVPYNPIVHLAQCTIGSLCPHLSTCSTTPPRSRTLPPPPTNPPPPPLRLCHLHLQAQPEPYDYLVTATMENI